MRRALIVFVGGGVGSCLRAALLMALGSWGGPLPAPVLLANLAGACALGAVYVLADEAGLLRAETRLFVAVGIMGGFTTFSTFSRGADVLLAHAATRLVALLYLMGSVGGGVAAVAAGMLAGRALVVLVSRLGRPRLERVHALAGTRTGGLRRSDRDADADASSETEDSRETPAEGARRP